MKEIKKNPAAGGTLTNRSNNIFASYTKAVKHLDNQVISGKMDFESAQLEKGEALANMVRGLNKYD